jgi:glycerate kinase
MIAAVDVRNPLLGEHGATRVFGSQKGAAPEQIELLERALTKLADTVARDLGCGYRDEPARARQTDSIRLMSLRSKIQSGFDVVGKSIGLESKMYRCRHYRRRFGSNTRGKTPAGVAGWRVNGKRVSQSLPREQDREVSELFDGVQFLRGPGMGEQESIARAPELLRQEARKLAKALAETKNAV